MTTNINTKILYFCRYVSKNTNRVYHLFLKTYYQTVNGFTEIIGYKIITVILGAVVLLRSFGLLPPIPVERFPESNLFQLTPIERVEQKPETRMKSLVANGSPVLRLRSGGNNFKSGSTVEALQSSASSLARPKQTRTPGLFNSPPKNSGSSSGPGKPGKGYSGAGDDLPLPPSLPPLDSVEETEQLLANMHQHRMNLQQVKDSDSDSDCEFESLSDLKFDLDSDEEVDVCQSESETKLVLEDKVIDLSDVELRNLSNDPNTSEKLNKKMVFKRKQVKKKSKKHGEKFTNLDGTAIKSPEQFMNVQENFVRNKNLFARKIIHVSEDHNPQYAYLFNNPGTNQISFAKEINSTFLEWILAYILSNKETSILENNGILGRDFIRLPDPTVIKPDMTLKDVYKKMNITWSESDEQ